MKIFTIQKNKKSMLNIKQGFTLIELLVVIAIMALLGSILWGGLSSYRDVQALESATDVVVATLGEARSRATSSVGNKQYGVHFTENSVTQFEGTQYVSSSPSNIVTNLNGAVSLSFGGLTASSSEIVFEKFSGRGSASGQVVIFLRGNPAKNFTVVMEPTGIAYRK